jgi:hypothetical protein
MEVCMVTKSNKDELLKIIGTMCDENIAKVKIFIYGLEAREPEKGLAIHMGQDPITAGKNNSKSGKKPRKTA